MAEVLIYGLPLIALIAAAFLVYYFFPAAFPPNGERDDAEVLFSATRLGRRKGKAPVVAPEA